MSNSPVKSYKELFTSVTLVNKVNTTLSREIIIMQSPNHIVSYITVCTACSIDIMVLNQY